MHWNVLNKFTIATVFLITLLGVAAASPAELTIFPKESSTRINSFTEYQVEVQNVGPVKDRYFMSSKSSEVTIAPSDFYLEPGQTKTVNVWYNPDVDKEAGTYSFSINAESSATGKTYSVNGIVNVIKEHEVNVEVVDSKTACLGEEVTYTIEVTNNGIQKEEFTVSSEIAEVSTKSMTLEDGETGTATLTVSSDKPVRKNFNVVVASKTSYAQDIETVEFVAETCYASDVSITPEQKRAAAFNTAEYQVTVRNTGTRADDFVLSTNIGELSQTEFELGSGNSKKVTLEVTPEKLGTRSIRVTSTSSVKSSDTATLEVYNGNDVEVSFSTPSRKVCEDEQFAQTVTVENTGEAKDTYKLTASRGHLGVERLTLQPGESKNVKIGFNASDYRDGKTVNTRFTAASQTFDRPTKSATASFTVQNCWDLEMNVVPKVASAGKNRSVVYEIQLENTGARQNTYQLAYEGPEWISVKPEEVTVASGKTETAYMYAGIPFQKKGQVEINVTSVGHDVQKSEQVTLVIGQEIEDAIESRKGGSITGRVTSAASNIADRLTESSNIWKVGFSIVVGLLIVLAVLYREW